MPALILPLLQTAACSPHDTYTLLKVCATLLLLLQLLHMHGCAQLAYVLQLTTQPLKNTNHAVVVLKSPTEQHMHTQCLRHL
jgi:hypothetical protein